jgi:hypothetical protein
LVVWDDIPDGPFEKKIYESEKSSKTLEGQLDHLEASRRWPSAALGGSNSTETPLNLLSPDVVGMP